MSAITRRAALSLTCSLRIPDPLSPSGQSNSESAESPSEAESSTLGAIESGREGASPDGQELISESFPPQIQLLVSRFESLPGTSLFNNFNSLNPICDLIREPVGLDDTACGRTCWSWARAKLAPLIGGSEKKSKPVSRKNAVERNRLLPRVVLVHARLARSRSQSMVTPDTEVMGV
jgi:hypothetical protein